MNLEVDVVAKYVERLVSGGKRRDGMSSWTQAGITVLGEKLLWTDLVGNVLSLATVWLAIRRTIWTWPVQLAGAVLLLVASVSAHVPGNALKQVMFLALAVVRLGPVVARHARGPRAGRTPGHRARARRAASARSRWAPPSVALLFAQHPLAADLLVAAGRTRTSSSAARSRRSRRAARSSTSGSSGSLVDLVGVPLAFKSGLYVSGAAYGIFFVIVLAGFRDWLKQYRRQRRTCEPKAVTA